MRVKNRTIFCIDRNSNVCTVDFDPTEYMFKLALVRQDQQQIMYLIQNSNLIGQAIIGYVRKKGYAEVMFDFYLH
jgi:coatomer protein complex subunit alpha (xenin)